MNNNDYKKLIEEFYHAQYSSCDKLAEEQNIWYPDNRGSEKLDELKSLKEKQLIIDATSYSLEEMKNKINSFRNVRIGNFRLQILNINANAMNILIFEEQKKKSANITVKVNPNKDSRFLGRSWVTYFNQFNEGKNIPLEEIPNILKWLQIIHRLPAFL